jgi:hypothetical protein
MIREALEQAPQNTCDVHVRLYSCKATTALPALCITKDWSLWAFLEDSATGPLTVSCSELMGFNVGSFVLEKRGEPGNTNSNRTLPSLNMLFGHTKKN